MTFHALANSRVRLVDGINSISYQSGRIEVRRLNEQWGTVCDNNFTDSDAAVICSMLGYPSGRAKTNAHFGPGAGRIWMDNLKCTGNESSIFDCDYSGWGLNNCTHSKDAGVECSGKDSIWVNAYYQFPLNAYFTFGQLPVSE